MASSKSIIIGIHGLGNKPRKELLEVGWKNAILEGLEVLGKPRDNIDFKLVYWADILHANPLDPEISDEEDPLYLENPYVRGTNFTEKEYRKSRLRFLDEIERLMENVFLSNDMSINFSKITDRLIHKYFSDLDAYYKATSVDELGIQRFVRQRIRRRLVRVLREYSHRKILLIAHSMGSIVAYDVLTLKGVGIAVDTLVTIGSPLGIPVVWAKIAAEKARKYSERADVRTPENVLNNWFNLSDLDDRIAMNYKLNDDYRPNSHNVAPIDFIVSNNYEFKGHKNPHASYGYLRTTRMAGIINDFLSYAKVLPRTSIRDRIRRLFSRTGNENNERY